MSTSYDPERTTLAPRGQESTAAYAWVSSPLGDPTDSASDRPYERNLPPNHPITSPTRRRPIDKTFVVGGLVGLVGAGAVLAFALFGNSSQPQNGGAAPAAPASAAPDNPTPAAVVAPLSDSPPPPADPGTQPDAAPKGPVVTANAPAPRIGAPVSAPQLPPPHSLPSAPKVPPSLFPNLPALPPLPSPPSLCLPPHHLVQGVCK
ncbi:hypothetical protein [Mycobacterium sp. 852002-51057_SCH5723018]|uniref:hypothetical protein n=1 Tax=Mycobacterium sp. 852002-51057_SCH5723018 TaxID=1834094 RepID=UPI000A4892BF|nr:hypothetical protein [Mycobacterium sp. 852002-51057_SCH5723018]